MADDVRLFDPDPGSLFADVTWEPCTPVAEVRLAGAADVDGQGGETAREHDDDAPLDLFAPLAAGLCNYGTPSPGDPRPCNEPATHAARWSQRRHPDDSRLGPWSGSLDACRAHADYYAAAWTPTYPAEWGAAWIDVLPHRHDADERLMPGEPDYHGTGYHGTTCSH